ncbi:MAG TPA: hypothetical protein PK867_17970 [Pirellulales bacterium]|nr:hypothetical protein [Pirellulales bacterium]
MARKRDIKLIDRVQKKYNLTKGQRRLLHKEMDGLKAAGQQLSKEMIEELAKEIVRLYPNQ